MNGNFARLPLLVTGLLAALFVVALVFNFTGRSSTAGATAAGSTTGVSSVSSQQVVPVATPGQDFQDVFPSDAFYTYLHNLYTSGVVGGYHCVPGGSTDPCVPPDNL